MSLSNFIKNSIITGVATYKPDSITGGLNLQINGQSLLQRISTNGFITLGAIGDSLVETQYGSSNLGGLVGAIRRFVSYRSFGDKPCYSFDGIIVPDVYAFEGYSGKQTYEILALAKSSTYTETYAVSDTIKVGVAARVPTFTLEVSGTNDISFAQYTEVQSGVALRRCIAGRRALWAYIRSCGSIPIALSLLPCQGSFVATGGAGTQDQLKVYRPSWNAAIKAAADADGVPWVDAYTTCVNDTGGWKTDYIKHNGVDDTQGLHPFMLGVIAISSEIKKTLSNIIGTAQFVPRLELGASPIYTATFATDGKMYFANFDTGLFPSTAGWSIRYNPQGDGTMGLSVPTQDVSGGGTLSVTKPASSSGGVIIVNGPDLTVAAGQEYIFFSDIVSIQTDSSASANINVCDRTTGSGSLYQPILAYNLMSSGVPSPVNTGVIRILSKYIVPTGINKISVQIAINSGSTSGLLQNIKISNVGQLRLA